MAKLLKENPVTNFSHGFFYPFRAVRFLLNHLSLAKYMAIPFLINTVVFSLAVYFGLDFFNDIVVGYIPQGETWYWAAIYYVLWILAGLLTAVLVFFTFTVVGNLIASPFNDLLSERTEELLLGRTREEKFSLKVFFRDAKRILWDELKKVTIFLVVMALLLLLNLVPGVGSAVYSVLSVLLTLFFLAVEYTGYVFERKHMGFSNQRHFILSRKFLTLGFGTGVLCFLAIPFVQFFCIPVAVVAATQMWVDTQAKAVASSEG